jgi:hypothetical protein
MRQSYYKYDFFQISVGPSVTGESFKEKKRCLCATFLLTVAAIYVNAQVNSGELHGVVTNANGRAISNATFTATAPERGITRTTTTDGDGTYLIPRVPPGTYTVRVEAPGFTTSIMPDVRVQTGEAVTLNATLEVGVTTEMTVTAAIPVVESDRTQQASTIDTERIENLR